MKTMLGERQYLSDVTFVSDVFVNGNVESDGYVESKTRLAVYSPADYTKRGSLTHTGDVGADGYFIIEAESGGIDINTGNGCLDLDKVSVRSATLNTTGNGYSNIIDIPLEDEHVYYINAKVTGRESDGSDRALYHLEGLFYRTGAGVATQEGSTTTITEIESDIDWDARFNASGDNVEIQVDSNGDNVDWFCVCEFTDLF